MNKQVSMSLCLLTMIVLAFATFSPALAQDNEKMRLARLSHRTQEYLEYDTGKAHHTEMLARISDPEELTRYREEFNRSELLDSAWAGVEIGNDLWKLGQRNTAQWCWLRTAISHGNTDASFASIMNLGTTMVEMGNLDAAMLAYASVLAFPTPQHRESFSRNIEIYRHAACLALSDLNLGRVNYNASLKYVELAISTHGADTDCGVYYFSQLRGLQERVEAIKQAKRMHAQVEWTD